MQHPPGRKALPCERGSASVRCPLRPVSAGGLTEFKNKKDIQKLGLFTASLVDR